jgi:broad specificity phosphatase PhoE
MVRWGRVVFVRHALPVVDDTLPSGLWPLTDDGRLAVQQVASRLKLSADELVVVSEELKAQQTAEALSGQVVVDPRLNEVERPWTDDGYRQLAETRLQHHQLEEWESIRSAVDRMEETVTDAIQKGDGSACLVTHGLIMSAYVGTIADIDSVALWSKLHYPDARTLDLDRLEVHAE